MLDPTLGRWTRQDPLPYAEGANLYEAVESAPAHRTDPSGLLSTTQDGLFGWLTKRRAYTGDLTLKIKVRYFPVLHWVVRDEAVRIGRRVFPQWLDDNLTPTRRLDEHEQPGPIQVPLLPDPDYVPIPDNEWEVPPGILEENGVPKHFTRGRHIRVFIVTRDVRLYDIHPRE